MGDAGLTGRKIIVDTYGGMARHGGGAFSRQGPVEGRPLGRLRRALRGQERRRRRPRRPREVQVAYAIGVAHPVSVMVETFGTEKIGRGRDRRSWSTSSSTCARARSASTCSLHRPIYQKTAAYGHFGREDHDFTWERPTRPQALREAAGLGAADPVA